MKSFKRNVQCFRKHCVSSHFLRNDIIASLCVEICKYSRVRASMRELLVRARVMSKLFAVSCERRYEITPTHNSHKTGGLLTSVIRVLVCVCVWLFGGAFQLWLHHTHTLSRRQTDVSVWMCVTHLPHRHTQKVCVYFNHALERDCSQTQIMMICMRVCKIEYATWQIFRAITAATARKEKNTHICALIHIYRLRAHIQ